MQSKMAMHASPRCHATTRAGTKCASPAMPNGRCHMRGGKSPGAPVGNQYAYKHGVYSREALDHRRDVMEYARWARKLTERV